MQAQFAHGVIHVQFDHFELVARLGGSGAHVLAGFARLALLLDVVVELLEVFGGGLLHGLYAAAFHALLRQLLEHALYLAQALAHTLGALRALLDGEVALQTTRLEDFLIDLRQLANLRVPLEHGLDGEITTAGHGGGEQQHEAETDEEFLAHGKVGKQTRGRLEHMGVAPVLLIAVAPRGGDLID